MQIGINLLQLRPDEIGGTETYVRGLIEAISKVDKKNEYTLICNDSNVKTVVPPGENFSLFVIPEAPKKPLQREIPLVNNSGSIRKKIENLSLDCIHFPFSYMFPLNKWENSVLTVHDLQHVYMPHFFSIPSLFVRNKNYTASIKYADLVISDSEFTKKTIIEKYGIKPEKIKVIYIGYDPRFRNKDRKMKEIKKRLKLPEKYIFYPAASWPHKNHLKLIDAFSMIKKDERYQDWGLVLTGAKKEGQAAIDRKISESEMSKSIFQLGRVPFDQLITMMQGAEMLVYPSLFEGFGMPVVEAMASGVPVACSNVTSLPEIAGNAALLFDPNNVEEIVDSIKKIAEDTKLRRRLVKSGNNRIKLFSWNKIALQTLKCYERVAKK